MDPRLVVHRLAHFLTIFMGPQDADQRASIRRMVEQEANTDIVARLEKQYSMPPGTILDMVMDPTSLGPCFYVCV